MQLVWRNQCLFLLIRLVRVIFQKVLIEAVRKNFDLRPAGIIEMLDLRHEFINKLRLMVILVEQILIYLGTNR